jgi:hypothetical protein
LIHAENKQEYFEGGNSHINLLTYGFLSLLALIGWRLFRWGRRGAVIDNHPVCARCKFDLTGRPKESGKCPECGGSLSRSAAIEVGNRCRRNGWMCAGLALLLLGTLPMLGGIGLHLMQVNPIRLAPAWWLLREAKRDASASPNKYAAELLARATNKKISPEDAATITHLALQFQADLTKPWQPVWGDIVEALQNNGQVSPADWQTYLSQDEPATLEVRANVAWGDPIPYHLSGEQRGATSLTRPRPGVWTLSIAASVPGAVTQFPQYSGKLGTAFDVTGYVPLTADSWNHLTPGPQTVTLRFAGVSTAMAAHPALFAAISKKGDWVLLKPGEAAVTMFHDEVLAAEVQKTITFHRIALEGSDNDIYVDVEAHNPPTDLAFEAILRSGLQEWSAPGVMVVARNGWGGGIFQFANVKSAVGLHADLILRPSIKAAATTVYITKLLDHEFVLKDVLIEKTR